MKLRKVIYKRINILRLFTLCLTNYNIDFQLHYVQLSIHTKLFSPNFLKKKHLKSSRAYIDRLMLPATSFNPITVPGVCQ